jgi:hypothetical protein
VMTPATAQIQTLGMCQLDDFMPHKERSPLSNRDTQQGEVERGTHVSVDDCLSSLEFVQTFVIPIEEAGSLYGLYEKERSQESSKD